MKKTIALLALFALAASFAQQKPAAEPGEAPALNWDAAPVDIVLQTYGEQVNKTVLKDPAVPNATITLKSREGQRLTKAEYLEAIEVVLEMNGIHLEAYGEKFVRALPRGKVRKEGIPLYMDITQVPADAKDGTVVSVMIPFKNIAADEAQKSLEALRSDTGSLLGYERTNSILVTDTWQNIKRMDEVVKAIDVASPVMENVFVRQIQNAAAQDVLTHLQKIVEESMKEQEKAGKGVQNVQNQPRTTILRPNRLLGGSNRTANPEPATTVESVVTSISDADRGMIRGKVLFLADERSNKLIVVTAKSNMDFFDKVIEQLDVETTPDTVVKVYRLKYADAEEASSLINDLIGNAGSSKSSSKGNQNAAAKTAGANVNATTGTTTPKKSVNQRTGEAKAGEISKENTTVLADKRINGLVVMTNKELVPVVESIIDSIDIKLSQVLIETAIIEVQLGDSLSTGIDWVLSGKNNIDPAVKVGSYGLAGGGGTAASTLHGLVGVATNSVTPIGSGINYLIGSDSLNIAAVIQASKSDSRSKYLASPVIMTVDNKEATIDATQTRQFLTGYQTSSSYYGSEPAPQYTSKDLGIKIKVTPKINPNGTVMLQIEEEYSQLGVKQTILDPKSNDVLIDTSLSRKMSADILLENHQTVVLGGLTETKTDEAETGIPLLKDLPYVGKWLFGSVKTEESRKELLVFMTPYVLDDGDAAQAEAIRRKHALSDARPWEDHGWSASELSDPVSKKEQLRRLKQEAKRQDEERDSRLETEKWKLERAKDLEKKDQELKKLVEKINREEEKLAVKPAPAEVKSGAGGALLKSLQSESEAERAK